MNRRNFEFERLIKGHTMTSKALLFVVISGLSIQIACSGKQTGEPAVAVQPVPAATITVQYEPVPAVVEVPGSVQPRDRISLSSQINGFVREMHVRAGDSVKKDQILVTLDARDAQSQKAGTQAAIDEAQAALSEARMSHQASVEMQAAAKASMELAGQTFIRYQKLFESRSISPQEFDEVRMRRNASTAELASREAMVAAAEDRIKQAEARISQAKAQAGRVDVMLGWAEIKAPSSGRIVQRLADPGTAIFPGTPLLVIESIDRPQVLANIPTEHVGSLHLGASVRLRDPETAKASEGRISEIIPLSDPATHSIQFKIDLPSNSPMTSGQYVKVEVPAGTRDALLAPRAAIRQTGQLTGMFVVGSTSKAQFRLVKVAPYDAARVEILSGLQPGERVISRLGDQITEGIPIAERSVAER
jgi:multidrug efflux pump subunit AcrA (membrane-fusion protein)